VVWVWTKEGEIMSAIIIAALLFIGAGIGIGYLMFSCPYSNCPVERGEVTNEQED